MTVFTVLEIRDRRVIAVTTSLEKAVEMKKTFINHNQNFTKNIHFDDIRIAEIKLNEIINWDIIFSTFSDEYIGNKRKRID
jgi:hypothetical protein